MQSNYKRLGDYIEEIDIRNQDLEVETLLGVSISKEFIPSVANTVGTNMKRYKIIKKNQFACSTMQVRRDKKMPVAILKDYDEAIISQAYPVFQVKDENVLMPDYLMMWFSRKEFDRQATFWAIGGVRGSLEWDDFLNFELPIPSIEKQQEIVNEYHTVVNRIKLNEQLNTKLEETAQALYKHWFVDFESKNKTAIGDILTPLKGKNITRQKAVYGRFPVIAGGINPSCYHNKSNTNKPVVTISASGANAGYINIYENEVWAGDCSFIDIDVFKYVFFIYCCLKYNQKLLMSKQTGTGQPHIYPEQISSILIDNCDINNVEEFNIKTKPLFDKIFINTKQNQTLRELASLLLSRMGRGNG